MTRREMMKALAIGSSMLGSVLVPLLSASAALAEEPKAAGGGQASPGGGIKITKILEQKLPDGKEVTIVTVVFPPGWKRIPIATPVRFLVMY